MNEELIINTSLGDPTDQSVPACIDTAYLVRTYGEFLTKESTEIKDFYIEKPLPATDFRSYRYVALTSKTEDPRLPIQDLAKLYSTDGRIWEKELSNGDLEKVNKVITLKKVSTGSARVGDAPVNMAKDITLTDGSVVNVEYVPYTEGNTNQILEDMNQHIDIAE
jgi:hypothetical protein